MSELVVLWLATSSSRFEVVEAKALSMLGMRVVRCSMRDVAGYALGASGSVIAVVDDDRAATEALGAGVDEVVRHGDLTEAELDRAAERAAARARTRLRALEIEQPADEADAMATLLDWVAIELVACVSGAVLEGDLLEESVRRLLARRGNEALTGEALPSSEDTLEMLDTVRESFRRMQEVLQAVRTLSGSDGSSGAPLGAICEALARMLQNRAIPLADVELEVEPGCGTSLRAAKLVGALVTLLGHVLDRATRDVSRGQRVRIVLRAFVAEGAAVLEVEDDLDTASERRGRGERIDPVTEVRKRLRNDGAEVQLASAPGRTTVRLLLPLVEISQPGVQEAPVRRVIASRAN